MTVQELQVKLSTFDAQQTVDVVMADGRLVPIDDVVTTGECSTGCGIELGLLCGVTEEIE